MIKSVLFMELSILISFGMLIIGICLFNYVLIWIGICFLPIVLYSIWRYQQIMDDKFGGEIK